MFFAPYPKNPVIGAFFREIDRADELGSGMRNLMKYGKAYGGADPQLIEADVFRMIISVPEFGEKQEKMAKVAQVGAHDGVYDMVHDGVYDIRLTETMKKIIMLLIEPKSTPQLLVQLGYPRRTRNYEAAIKGLLDFKLIEMTLPDKPRSKNQQYRLTEKGKHLIA
ncbi:MAG: Fic family protein [Chlorobium sp.]